MDDNRITGVGAINRFGFKGYSVTNKRQMVPSHQNCDADLTSAINAPTENDRKAFNEKDYLKSVYENAQAGSSSKDTHSAVDRKCIVKLRKRSRNVSSDSGQVTGFSSDEEDTDVNAMKDLLTKSLNENQKGTGGLTEDCNENVLGCGEDMAFDELAENVSFRDILLSLEDTSFAPLAVLSVPDKSSKIEDESFPELPNDKCSVVRCLETDSSFD